MMEWNDLAPGQIFVNEDGETFVLVEVVLDISQAHTGYFYALFCLDGGGHIYESCSYTDLGVMTKAITKAKLTLVE